ncbi:N-6 DNA methylase [Nocardiopsis sp. RSe5-2]|uniref:N-6 DNA methylase n=1 Tax=Nocardiopsis endophytica TaxID=3018445 RepID=A0ABT4U424_9ACTN|nr:N-6 DNA methylase [Nocardiopsis endophytica]MDA2811706.1 N-6 DNA methylase [Nocardiopsis endophytica]
MPPADAEIFLTKSQIAQLSEVAPSAVANWRNRHSDFPEPVHRSGTARFRLPDVLDWLTTRTIPANRRRGDEDGRSTYADRARSNLHRFGIRQQDVEGTPPTSASDAEAPDGDDVEAVVDRLLDHYGRRAADQLPLPDYVLVVGCLLASRHQPRAWSAIRGRSRSAFPPPGPETIQAIDQAALALITNGHQAPQSILGGRELDGRLLSELIGIVDRLTVDSVSDVFDLLLVGFAKRTGQRSGEQVTPKSITTLAAALILATGVPATVYDPYCRTGEFLSAVTEDAVSWRGGEGPVVTARHPQGALVQLARLTMAFRAMRGRLGQGLDAPWTSGEQSRFDAVLTNPPFNNRTTAGPQRQDPGVFPFGPPPVGDDNMAWVQYAATRLKPEGRAVVVMPNAAASSSHPQNRATRERLIDSGVVEAVIALPDRLFFGTNIPVCLWVLRSAYGRPHPGGVVFIDAGAFGRMVDRTRRELTPTDVEEVIRHFCIRRSAAESRQAASALSSNVSVVATSEQIRAENFSLVPATYVVPERRNRPESGRPDPVELAHTVERAASDAVPADLAAEAALFQRAEPLDIGDVAGPWENAPLNELCEVQSGPSGSTLKQYRSESGTANADSPVRLVLPKAVRGLRIAPGATEGLPDDLPASLRRYRTQPGDLLMVRIGTIGRVALVEFDQEDWLISTNLIRIRTKANIDIDPEFLLGYLSHPDVQAWIDRHTTGSAIRGISGQALGNLRIPVPPPGVQRRIGALMRRFEEQIRVQRRALQVAEHARNALAESIFDLR